MEIENAAIKHLRPRIQADKAKDYVSIPTGHRLERPQMGLESRLSRNWTQIIGIGFALVFWAVGFGAWAICMFGWVNG